MKNSSIIFIAVLILAFAAVIAFMLSTPVQHTAQKPLTIGVILPLSGNIAKAGNDAKAALEIAREDLRTQFPHVDLIYEDDMFQPKESVTAFKKLTEVNQVDAVIGPLNGSSIEAVRALANATRIVAITPWGSANKIDNFLLKDSLEVEDETALIANTAIHDLGLKRLGILYFQNDYGEAQRRAFKKSVAELGGQLVIEEAFPVPAVDWRTELTKVKAARVEALYIIHNGANVGRITNQAYELGLDNVRFFGQYGTESSDLVAVGGKSLEGLIFTSTINPEGSTIDPEGLKGTQKRFAARFQAKTGGAPQAVAYHIYDIYTILVPAIAACKNAGEEKGVCVSQHLISRKAHEGVSGTFSFTGGKVKRPLYLKTVRNGQLATYRP